MPAKPQAGSLVRTAVAAMRYAMHLATVCLFAMTSLVVLSSVVRYFFGAPFRVTEELVGLLFATMAFLVWPLSTLRGEHIEVTFVSSRLSKRAQPLLKVFSSGAMIVFCVVFGIHSYDFAMFSLKLGAKSDAADIPLFGWMAVMPVVCVMIVLALAVRKTGMLSEKASKDSSLEPLRD